MRPIPGRYRFGSRGRYRSAGAAIRGNGSGFGRLGCFSRDVDMASSEVANQGIIGNHNGARSGTRSVEKLHCPLRHIGASRRPRPTLRNTNKAKILTEFMAKDTGQKAGKRILLVDDDAEIVESLRLALESNGYNVLVARDGNQGLALSERENPDLVILDMMMPKRSGFLVLEKMRRTRETPLRVIMITANEGSRHKAYAEMLGVDDYIRKPFPMDRLVDAVERRLA